MNVKRYFAQTAREALRALKAELGADAIVLSNRAVEGGVEILALPADAVGTLHAARPTPSVQHAARVPDAPPAGHPGEASDEDFHVSLSGRGASPSRAAPKETPRKPAPQIRPFNPPRMETPDYLMRNRVTAAFDEAAFDGWDTAELEPARPARTETRQGDPDRGASARSVPVKPAARAVADVDRAPERRPDRATDLGLDDERVRALQEANARLMEEMAGIRNMIERQLAGFAWGEERRKAPGRAQLVGELLEAGFSAVLARQLVEEVSESSTPREARLGVKEALSRGLRAMSSDADLIDKGGVYALVGPTGVGKTTTTAKMAARCVVRHGAEKLALITTDGYRIGAQEQLRIYGRILGVPVFSVRDGADLRQTLAELRDKHMVLIDTMGMSQKDRMVAEQAAMLMGAGQVRRLLLLNATCRGDTLDDVVNAYSGPDLAGCIFTKVDEAASLAPVLGAAIAHELDIFYVANGQRVPEDLHLPNRAYLLHRALRAQAEDSPWKLQGDEPTLMMAAGA